VAAAAVPAEYAKLLTVLQDPKHAGRILSSNLNEQDRQNVTGTVDFEIARAAAASVETALASPTADVYARNVTRSSDAQNTLDSKVHYTVTIVDATRLESRELHTLELEVADVDKALRDAIATAESIGGRVIANQQLNKQSNGQSDAQVIVDVPLNVAPAAGDKLRALGAVKLSRNAVNPAVSSGSLARARFNVVLRSPAPLVAPENTIGAHVRSGLQTSLKGLAWSLTLIIVGLCLVGPFALIIWAGWKLARRAKSSPGVAKT
jgi:hypothetical protein